MFSRALGVMAHVPVLLLPMANNTPLLGPDTSPLSIDQPEERDVCTVHLWAVMIRAATSVQVHVPVGAVFLPL